MSNEIRVIVADEAENFLGWRVNKTADGIHCRIWVLRHSDAENDRKQLAVPATNPDFEDILPTAEEAVEYLAGEDVFLRTTAIELVGELG